MAKLYFYYEKNPLQWLLSSKLNVVVNNEEYFIIHSKTVTVKEIKSGSTSVQISAPYLGSEVGKTKEEFLVNEGDEIHITYKSPLLVFSPGTIFIEKGKRSDFKTQAVSEFIKTYFKIFLFVFIFMVMIGIFYGIIITNLTKNIYQSNNAEVTSNQESTQSTEDKVEVVESTLTVNQQNAIRKAETYLNIMAFSRDGLVTQLEYEGFSNEDALYGADHCGADWLKQAVSKSKQYLSIMAFSRSGLIQQLEYEGFTTEEANYGVDNSSADWMKQAELKAKQYLDIMAYSRDGLLQQLEFEGFTQDEAIHGVDSTGLK